MRVVARGGIEPPTPEFSVPAEVLNCNCINRLGGRALPKRTKEADAALAELIEKFADG